MFRTLLRRLNPFYSPITFSIMAEDPRVVERALRPSPGQRLLCLGSSGDTALSLLRLAPGRVDAVDNSFAQIAEIALKREALRQLEPSETHRLLGVVRDGRQAQRFYRRLRPNLDASVRSFWDGHQYMIRRGLIWEGGLQRLIRFGQWVLRPLVGATALGQLREATTSAAAAAVIDRLFASRRCRLAVRLIVNRATVSSFYPGVGLTHLPPGSAHRDYVMQRLRTILVSRPLGSHPQLLPFLFEEYPTEDSLPPYLRAAELPAIRRSLDKLQLVYEDVVEYMAALDAGSIDGFALCNVVDWLNDEQLDDFLAGLVRAGRPGARFLLYSRSRPLIVPEALRDSLQLDAELSRNLASADRIGYYRYTFAGQLAQ